MLCQRCRRRKSTGFLVHLCDPCFDEWEAEVKSQPDKVDLGPLDLACKRQKAGGLIPNDAKGIRLRGKGENVRIDIVR